MTGYLIDIETKPLESGYFREVLFTGAHQPTGGDPPVPPQGTVHKTKGDAMAYERELGLCLRGFK